VFRSASKSAATPLLGIEGLKAIVRAVDRPVLAIGGITNERIGTIAAAGAAGFAAIGLFMADRAGAEAGCRAAELRQTVKQGRARFDRLNTTP
jgi:thiamine-phosphate pyrophosphorylase